MVQEIASLLPNNSILAIPFEAKSVSDLISGNRSFPLSGQPVDMA